MMPIKRFVIVEHLKGQLGGRTEPMLSFPKYKQQNILEYHGEILQGFIFSHSLIILLQKKKKSKCIATTNYID